VHLRETSTAFLLIALLLLSTLLTGCGGGDQTGSGSQEGGSAQKKGSPPETKIVIGMVRVVKPETRKVVLKPSTEEQGETAVPLKIGKNARITLDGKKAELSDIEKRQQAKIEYFVKDGVNQAIAVDLFGTESQPSSEQQSSEQPAGGGEGTG